jgi:O-Antigen ligase
VIVAERRWPAAAAGAVAAALVVYYSFNAGGFFADTPAIVAVATLLVLAARMAVVERPFAGFGRGAAAGAAALGALAGWTLLSAAWSDAPGRAVLEGDRVLAYLLVLVLFAAGPFGGERLRWIVRGVAVGAIVVCVAALASRLAPDVFTTAPNIVEDRLSFPLTYWNALALLAAIGLALCVALASDPDEPWGARVGAAAAVPCLATTALLTFSRGGLVVAVLAVALTLFLGRPRAAAAALAAVALPTAVALVFAYRAPLLATQDPTSARAAAQGHRVAIVVIVATLAAGALLYSAERILRVRRVRGLPLGRRARVAAVALTLALLAVPVYHEVRRFGSAPAVATATDARARLTDPSSNGRVDYWRAALDGFRQEPLHGTGAGTYQLTWWRYRRTPAGVMHAHSLYLEALSDLGVVGLVLVLASLAAPLAGLARRINGSDRLAAGALLASAIAWTAHAALDWDWQVPAVTAWLFAAGGAALARPAPERGRGLPLLTRAGLGAALLVLAAGPALIAVSEHETEAALAAYTAGDCRRAASAARTANRALALRAEPSAVLGLCAARDGRYAAAITDMRTAHARDPGSWEYWYGLAIVRAAAGRDPRPDITAALRLDPREPALHAAALSFATTDPLTWKRGAASAPLSIDGLDYPPLGG